MGSSSLTTLVMWLTVGVVALLGMIAGIAATDTTRTARARWLYGTGCAVALLLGGISKCGDRRVRTLLYEAANVMLTRCKAALKLKDWALAIARRTTMRKARIALARRLAIIMHAMLRDGGEFNPA